MNKATTIPHINALLRKTINELKDMKQNEMHCSDMAHLLREVESLTFAIKSKKPWFSDIVENAWLTTRADFFHSTRNFIDELTERLNERDEPMSRETIKQIFDYSGIDYKESDIDACKPDSQEIIDEQISYYNN